MQSGAAACWAASADIRSVTTARTKMRKEHLVPLSKQARAVLNDLHRLNGRQPLVFPSLRPSRPLSDNTLGLALRSMGIPPTEHVPHGFRASASSILHEAGFDSQVIELQLAHSDKDKVRAIYNRAERLAERKELMQAWADLCDAMVAVAPRHSALCASTPSAISTGLVHHLEDRIAYGIWPYEWNHMSAILNHDVTAAAGHPRQIRLQLVDPNFTIAS